jgi:putative oxidoreductase
MKKIIFDTKAGYAPLAVRILLSLVLFPHGAQKLLGWFDGYGFDASMNYFTGFAGLPSIVGFLVIVIEFFGPIFILLGLATRLWSFGVLSVMTGIIITTFNDYFFMNWFGAQKEEGFEFFLLVIGMALSLIISGAGKFSIDSALFNLKSNYPATK